MEKIIHNGAFYRAERVDVDCLAAIWSKPNGGEIEEYRYLGRCSSADVARDAAQTEGDLSLRQNQTLSFSGVQFEVNGEVYKGAFVVHTYRT